MPTKSKTKSMISNDIVLRYKAVSLFRDAAARLAPLADLAVCERTETRIELCARIFRAVADSECVSTGEWAAKLVLRDDNPFSRAAARGARIDERIKTRVTAELDTFKQLSLVMPSGAKGITPEFVYGGFAIDYDRLVDYYSVNGCGELAASNMFVYSDGVLRPTETALRLSDLAGYAEEKAEIVANTENFIKGRPAFHTLLVGARGTGKSSTVRALAQEYKGKLKIIELSGRNIEQLPELRHRLAGLAQKYIIFIDDIKADARATDILKPVLDAPSASALVYCTLSADKPVAGDGVPVDGFGLVVTYVDPDRYEFDEILKSILCRRGIKWRDEYSSVAEIVTLKRGARSPRTAKQIADLIESTYAENK